VQIQRDGTSRQAEWKADVVGEFQRSFAALWRIVFASAAVLAASLRVAVHRIKKPFIYAGFDNLTTDEHRCAQILSFYLCLICVNLWRKMPEPKKFKLVIAYDGTAYDGWQAQKIGTGVQQIVEAALAELFPSAPRLHSSSRTDTGVHALGMVAHFEIPSGGGASPPGVGVATGASRPPAKFRMTARKLVLALNAHLPEDVRVLSAARARAKFHAQFDAGGKQYRYFVWNHAAMNPLLRRTAWHVPRKLDLNRMRAAAKWFVGRHDFRSFAANPGYQKTSTVRRLTRCDVRRSGAQFTFLIEGGGFLYKMCRGIVGTIVQAGLGQFPPAEIKAMLAKKDRRAAGMTAPAHGLVLWKVFYSKPRSSRCKEALIIGKNE
jgi:tRNA pseudouridine38-40 synthase